MNEDQMEFFEQTAFPFTPDPARSKPQLWIERLIIWEKPSEVKRKVLLKPGLNIIWTPDESAGGEFFPHDRGKTLFCRLIRYCLGEKNYGTKEQEQLLSREFSAGAVGANIIIDGIAWSVVRAFNPVRTTFVLKNGNLETMWNGAIDPNYQGIEALITAITTTLLGDAPALMPLGLGKENAWATVLSWATRDNDDDFREATSWRHSESQSGSPVARSSAADRTLAIRAILGLLSAEEAPVHQGIKDLETKREDYNNTQAIEKKLFDRRVLDLAHDMGMEDESNIEELRHAANSRRSDARQARKRAYDALAGARKDLAEAESNLVENEILAALTKEAASRVNSMALTSRNCSNAMSDENGMQCPGWNVSVSTAAERGCQLAMAIISLNPALPPDKPEASMAEETTKLKRHVVDESCRQKLEPLKERIHRLFREVVKKDEEVRKWDYLRARANNLNPPVDGVGEDDGQTELRKWQLINFQAQAKEAIKALSNRFHDVCMELAPDADSGTVRLSTDRLELSLNTGGKGNTKATKALKVIAFDLAAMVMSIEGPTCFPGFLVHDGPRVGELCSHHYDKIFRFVRMLESPKKNDSLFQYIICTTTDPPKELQGSDYVCLKMFGPLPHGYLFKTDL